MTLRRLPPTAGDGWSVSWVFDEDRAVEAVSAGGGLVVAAGRDLHRLSPGKDRWTIGPSPELVIPGHVAAAEAVGEQRFAIASSKAVGVLFSDPDRRQHVLRLANKPGGRPLDEISSSVMNLAWANVGDRSTLWLVTVGRTLMRMRPDLSDLEVIDQLGDVEDIASDGTGTLAFITVDETGNGMIFTSRDGAQFTYRPVGTLGTILQHLEIAVAGEAVAVLVDRKYILLSRAIKEPFTKVEGVGTSEDGPYATGAIAFQGSKSDAALFVAKWERGHTHILRVDASGATTTVAKTTSDETIDGEEIVSLAWDEARNTLWAASPTTGILRVVRGDAPARVKQLLS